MVLVVLVLVLVGGLVGGVGGGVGGHEGQRAVGGNHLRPQVTASASSSACALQQLQGLAPKCASRTWRRPSSSWRGTYPSSSCLRICARGGFTLKGDGVRMPGMGWDQRCGPATSLAGAHLAICELARNHGLHRGPADGAVDQRLRLRHLRSHRDDAHALSAPAQAPAHRACETARTLTVMIWPLDAMRPSSSNMSLKPCSSRFMRACSHTRRCITRARPGASRPCSPPCFKQLDRLCVPAHHQQQPEARTTSKVPSRIIVSSAALVVTHSLASPSTRSFSLPRPASSQPATPRASHSASCQTHVPVRSPVWPCLALMTCASAHPGGPWCAPWPAPSAGCTP